MEQHISCFKVYEERKAVGAALASLNTNGTPLNSGQF